MTRSVDPRKLTWICRPKLFIQSADKLILETEPFTDLRPFGKSAEAIELTFSPGGYFCFTVRVDYMFNMVFDQCGIILYKDGQRKAVLGTEYRDEEVTKLHCTVFHGEAGDRSLRDIGSKIHTIYYRVWYRGGAVRLQYSFAGERFSDFREFRLNSRDQISLGIYACSPANSYFDCTFSGMSLQEDMNDEL